MKLLVLGGCGSQGRAALYDLSKNASVAQITRADIQPELIHCDLFMGQLNKRGIKVNETIEQSK